MDRKTYDALQASIDKWDRNAEAKEFRDASVDAPSCPLCNLFFRSDCSGCPVSAATEEMLCRATPYPSASHAYDGWWGFDGGSKSDKYRAAFNQKARAEALFLRALRPFGGPCEEPTI